MGTSQPASGEDGARWRANAEALVERIIEHADDYGDVANTTGDDLRDALRLACEWLADARAVLVFADGVVVSKTAACDEFTFTLADLYSEDYSPAQDALRRAGCHPRGKFLAPANGGPLPLHNRPDGTECNYSAMTKPNGQWLCTKCGAGGDNGGGES